MEDAAAILTSIYEEIEEFGFTSVDPTVGDPITIIEKIALRFDDIARQLRRRHGSRETLNVQYEYDAQDLLHALLKLFFIVVRVEEWTRSYAGTSSRMDFLLYEEETVIEVKMTRAGLRAKDLVDQLLVDITRYEKHPSCESLVCFVYDPDGWIGNTAAITTDIEKTDGNLAVRVFVQP